MKCTQHRHSEAFQTAKMRKYGLYKTVTSGKCDVPKPAKPMMILGEDLSRAKWVRVLVRCHTQVPSRWYVLQCASLSSHDALDSIVSYSCTVVILFYALQEVWQTWMNFGSEQLLWAQYNVWLACLHAVQSGFRLQCLLTCMTVSSAGSSHADYM